MTGARAGWAALAVAAVAGACGGGSAAPADAACGDAAVCGSACEATFSGDFSDSSRSPANCAAVGSGSAGDAAAPGDVVLTLSAQSNVIGSPLAVAIDLGPAPAAGAFSSETIASWSAVQAQGIGDGGCVYSAGTEIVPVGSFTLTLTQVTAGTGGTAHGTLALLLTVHALEASDCGIANTETVDIEF